MGCAWNLTGSECGPVESSCEIRNEPSGSVKNGTFCGQPSDCHLLRKESTPCTSWSCKLGELEVYLVVSGSWLITGFDIRNIWSVSYCTSFNTGISSTKNGRTLRLVKTKSGRNVIEPNICEPHAHTTVTVLGVYLAQYVMHINATKWNLGSKRGFENYVYPSLSTVVLRNSRFSVSAFVVSCSGYSFRARCWGRSQAEYWRVLCSFFLHHVLRSCVGGLNTVRANSIQKWDKRIRTNAFNFQTFL